MGRAIIDEVIEEFAPAAVGVAETKGLFSVEKGDKALSVSAVKLVLAGGATTSTLSVGDGGSLTRFIGATDTETGAVADVVEGVVANFPFTYTADDTIDIDYVIGATPGTTNPRWRVTALIVRSQAL